jgi:DHA1 family bicyclomycin/chloramphenicol resistance-like MFS transporter
MGDNPGHTFMTEPAPKPPIWLLVLITISGTLAMHMFVPALTIAALDLGASTSAMQMTIGVYILGLAGGQLLYGPMSDAFGRRPLLLLGLSVYTFASAAAAFAPDVHTLVLARLFQALGGCAGLALGRAIVRDISGADEAVRDLALLNLMMMAGPGLAPVLGSALGGVLGWRAIFALLALMGCMTLVLAWHRLTETGVPTGKINLQILLHDYRQLLWSGRFMGFAIGGGCATTSIYAFIAAAPFVITAQLHRPVFEVGLYLGLIVSGMAVGNALTRHLSRSHPVERILGGANLLGLMSAVALLVLVLSDNMTLWGVVGVMCLFAIGAGAASPAALSKALGAVPAEVVGSAAGLYGFLQMLIGASCTFALGFFSHPALAAAGVLVLAMVVSQTGIRIAIRS